MKLTNTFPFFLFIPSLPCSSREICFFAAVVSASRRVCSHLSTRAAPRDPPMACREPRISGRIFQKVRKEENFRKCIPDLNSLAAGEMRRALRDGVLSLCCFAAHLVPGQSILLSSTCSVLGVFSNMVHAIHGVEYPGLRNPKCE